MKPRVGNEERVQSSSTVLSNKGNAPARDLLKGVIASNDRDTPGTPYYVLRLVDLEPWTSINRWLERHLNPVTGEGISLQQALDPFHYWQASDPNFPAERITFVNCSLQLGGDLADLWRQLKGQIPKELRDKIKEEVLDCTVPPERENLFDAVDATPLLYYPDWRLAIARLLRYVKPGGVILFPRFNADALILDGQVADWARDNENRVSTANTFLRTLCWLYLHIEDTCNRPWIPEISLSKPDALQHLLKHLLEYDDEKDQEAEERFPEIRFTPRALKAEEYFDLHSINAYISPSEREMILTALQREQGAALNPVEGGGEKTRDVQFGCTWHCVRMPTERRGLSPRRINDAAVLSLTSERRNLLDTEHHLLPEFTAELDEEKDTPREIEDKILRSLRGFVCRTIHHDRFDPENHHLFVASLWIPKRGEYGRTFDLSEGRFSDVTGCVFRRKSKEPADILDEALRSVTYWAHAQAAEMSLQTIPQILFDTDRPVIRIRRSQRSGAGGLDKSASYNWQYSIEGDSQPDIAKADLSNIDSSAKVPAEICFTIPDLDYSGANWKAFKKTYLTRTILKRDILIGGEKRSITDQLSREIWPAQDGSLYSFPWDTSRIKRRKDQNKELDKFSWDDFAKGLPRGVAAGLITDELAEVFSLGLERRSNPWINTLLSQEGEVEECFRSFNDMFNELLEKLGVTPQNRKRFDESSEKVFSALLALTLVFPISETDGQDWELLQVPVGAFLHGGNKKFVSAGACVLLKRTRSTQEGLTPDQILRQDLAEVRSSQLLRRVPTVLLPLSTLLLVNSLKEESIQSRLQEERAESARGLLHNLRNLISPALDLPEGARYIFKKDFEEPERRRIAHWESQDWWKEHVQDTKAASVIKDWHTTLLRRMSKLSHYLHMKGASAVWVKRTLNAYYMYLSGGEQGKGSIVDALDGTMDVIWEMWSTPTTWTPTASKEVRDKIDDGELLKRNRNLLDARLAAAKSKPWSDQIGESREWWVKPGGIRITWTVEVDEMVYVSSPAIAFHVFYELIWNGLKHIATMKFIEEPERPDIMEINVNLAFCEDENGACFTYSQSCFDMNINDIVNTLNGKFDKNSHVFRGLMGIPNMARRCGWSVTAENSEAQLLLVKLRFPIHD